MEFILQNAQKILLYSELKRQNLANDRIQQMRIETWLVIFLT
jgi:hypothetical protein